MQLRLFFHQTRNEIHQNKTAKRKLQKEKPGKSFFLVE
jgi:hypothetical protein